MSHSRRIFLARYAVLPALLLIALTSWGLEHLTDGHALGLADDGLQHSLSLMGVLGAVLGGWLSKSSKKGIT